MAVGATLVAAVLLSKGSGWRGNAELHTLADVVTTLLGALVGATALLRYYSKPQPLFFLVGAGFTAAACLDAYHAILSSTWFASLAPIAPQVVVRSWFPARLVLAVALVWAGWVGLGRVTFRVFAFRWFVLSVAALSALGLFAVWLIPLQAGLHPEWAVPRPGEFLPALLFLCALAGLMLEGSWKTRHFEHWLALSLVLNVVAQLSVSYSAVEHDGPFALAHLIKAVSFSGALVGLAIEAYLLFKQEDATFAAVIEAINRSQMVAEFKMGGTLIAANDRFCAAMGYRLDEIIGRDHRMFFDPATTDGDAYERLWAALRRGEPQSGQFRRLRKDGREVWIAATYTPIVDRTPRPFKVMKFATDVSDSVAAQRQVQDQQARNLAIVNTIVEGVITIDDHGTVETYNPAAARIFGYPAAEAIGRNANFLMPEPHHTGHDGYLARYRETGKAKVIGIGREVSGRRKDGSTFPMELAVSELVLRGKRMFTGTVRDVTERNLADKMKREFVSTVSHELRTPLTSITGSLGLIRTGVAGAVPEKLKKLVEIAYTNADRLARLINDILDVEKIESGKMDFRMAPLDLSELVREAIDAHEHYAGERRVRTVLPAQPASRALVDGDRDRLTQVMANLLSNAIKYSPVDSVVEVSVLQLQSQFRVSVADHGQGIPVEFRPRIFGKFAQADSSDARQKGAPAWGSISRRASSNATAGRSALRASPEWAQPSILICPAPCWRRSGHSVPKRISVGCRLSWSGPAIDRRNRPASFTSKMTLTSSLLSPGLPGTWQSSSPPAMCLRPGPCWRIPSSTS